MRNDKDNIVLKLTFDFDLKIIAFSERLRGLKNLKWQLNYLKVVPQLVRI